MLGGHDVMDLVAVGAEWIRDQVYGALSASGCAVTGAVLRRADNCAPRDAAGLTCRERVAWRRLARQLSVVTDTT